MTRTLSPENLKQSGRDFPVTALSPIEQLILFVGQDVWAARLADIAARSSASNRFGSVLKQRHALELALERMRGRGPDGLPAAAGAPAAAPSVAEQRLHAIVVEAVSASVCAKGCARRCAAMRAS
jgi:hypothetical protein